MPKVDPDKIIQCYADDYKNDNNEDAVLEDWILFLEAGGKIHVLVHEGSDIVFDYQDWCNWIITTRGFIDWADEEVEKDIPGGGCFWQERISNADDRSILGLDQI